MNIRHGGLVVGIPDDWQDRSTLLFVGPSRAPRLPATAPMEATHAAVAVSFVARPDADARGLLSQQAEELRVADPSYALVSEAPLRCGLGEGWVREQRVHVAGVTVRQLAAAFVVGPLGVLATASAAEVEFDARRPELLRALASLRAVPAE